MLCRKGGNGVMWKGGLIGKRGIGALSAEDHCSFPTSGLLRKTHAIR